MDDIFNLERYYNNLKTCSLGRPCLYLDQVDSTINVAASESPNTLVLAKEQLSGKGQGNNKWHSPQGCAMASLRLVCNRVSPIASRICFLQHLVALAVVKTLEQIDSKKLGQDRIKLKWPNDIVYMPQESDNVGLKIGGILVRTAASDTDYDVIMSFGLNVLNSEPTTCVQDIIGPSKRITIDQIVAEILNKLETYTIGFTEDTFQSLKSDYTSRCLQIDRLVEDELNGRMEIHKIDDDGFLVGKRCSDLQECTVTKIIQVVGLEILP